MAQRQANAVWEGGLKDGKGTMKFDGYEGPYTWASRFEEAQGTNPEELIGAAHAGCFSMALSSELGKAGYPPKRIQTNATVYLEPVDGKNSISRIHLATEAQVPGIDAAKFQELANAAKAGCPVSRALTGVQISLDAKLV